MYKVKIAAHRGGYFPDWLQIDMCSDESTRALSPKRLRGEKPAEQISVTEAEQTMCCPSSFWFQCKIPVRVREQSGRRVQYLDWAVLFLVPYAAGLGMFSYQFNITEYPII